VFCVSNVNIAPTKEEIVQKKPIKMVALHSGKQINTESKERSIVARQLNQFF